MRVHFIAIGGAAMHNLAIALHLKGFKVSGSDDEVFDPSKSRLEKYGLLPEKWGWNASSISLELDAVILGMHAKEDNPELLEAQRIGLKIYSFPEYLYEQSKDKKRIVIGGSHGKTTITAMILHVFNHHNIECDYMVGAKLEGFEVMVRLSDSAKFMIIEGDEYLTSPIDRRPKFHLYMPDVALISGIAWDHVNVFPTFDNYLEQFRIFANLISTNGSIIYFDGDENVDDISIKSREDISKIAYNTPEHTIREGVTYLKIDSGELALKIFGDHNLINMEGARRVCEEAGIDKEMFYEAIVSFTGASKRLELVAANKNVSVFKDFAHSPSKLEATANAVKKQFGNKGLVACLELHTFSSLNEEFLKQYKGTMDSVDTPIIYYNEHTIKLKRLPPISQTMVKEAFGRDDLLVYTDSSVMLTEMMEFDWRNNNLLMMSSGSFDGVDFDELAENILSKGKS